MNKEGPNFDDSPSTNPAAETAGYVMTMEMTLLCWVVVFSCLLGDDGIAAEMEFKLT